MFSCDADHRALHSFPTRRSSDLPRRTAAAPGAGAAVSRRAPLGVRNAAGALVRRPDRKSTRLNSSHVAISYAVFCLKKKKPGTKEMTAYPLRHEMNSNCHTPAHV